MKEIYKISEIKEKLNHVLAAEPVYRAILFGSYAKGNADENSDVDIVIDSRGELHGLQFYGVLSSIAESLNKPVDLIEISELQPNSHILNDIIKEGVILYER